MCLNLYQLISKARVGARARGCPLECTYSRRKKHCYFPLLVVKKIIYFKIASTYNHTKLRKTLITKTRIIVELSQKKPLRHHYVYFSCLLLEQYENYYKLHNNHYISFNTHHNSFLSISVINQFLLLHILININRCILYYDVMSKPIYLT